MNIRLSAHEARVIGCLLEKEITTPDQYPLSLNALTNACNQKSNRDPVLDLSESEVQNVLDALASRRLVLAQSGFGSRVAKYQQRFCNTEFGSLKLSAQEVAILCELLLRGPQMPGELRSRASRLAAFRDVGELEGVLDQLANRDDGPFVAKLVREAGRRESRYMHLFSGDAPPPSVTTLPQTPSGERTPTSDSRASATGPAERLQAEMSALRAEVATLRAEVAELLEAVERLRTRG